MGKINVYDKIMIENQKKMEIISLISSSKRWFTNEIHSAL